MLRWKFRVYVSHTGRCDVQDTVTGYDDYASAAFSRAVEHLAVTPLVQWDEPHCKKLKNEDPLYEIRFKANNRATRAIGYFQAPEVFVILLICFHKGRVYSPPDAFKTCHRRIKQITIGNATTRPLQIDGEDFQ